MGRDTRQSSLNADEERMILHFEDFASVKFEPTRVRKFPAPTKVLLILIKKKNNKQIISLQWLTAICRQINSEPYIQNHLTTLPSSI